LMLPFFDFGLENVALTDAAIQVPCCMDPPVGAGKRAA